MCRDECSRRRRHPFPPRIEEGARGQSWCSQTARPRAEGLASVPWCAVGPPESPAELAPALWLGRPQKYSATQGRKPVRKLSLRADGAALPPKIELSRAGTYQSNINKVLHGLSISGQ